MKLDTIDGIISFVLVSTQRNWHERKEPLLLSILGSEMLVTDSGYRDVIAPMSLREFISSNATGKLQFVQHPKQKAKIGIIPANEVFSYPADSDIPLEIGEPHNDKKPGAKRRTQGKYVVQNFLDLLSELEAEDIARVSIPIDVIAKMIQSR